MVYLIALKLLENKSEPERILSRLWEEGVFLRLLIN